MTDPVTLTITTCQRYSLFRKTLQSLTEKCWDLDLIDSIVCVDDNSSEEDRYNMEMDFRRLFPKSRALLIRKAPIDRGLGQSLNLIWSYVDTQFIFHIEDDWEFIKEGHFIRDGLNIIKETEDVKSVLVRYHDFLPKKTTKKGSPYHLLEIGARVNHGGGTWIHGYSLNPSVQDLGSIKEKMTGFPLRQVEYDFGREYYSKGLRSATLMDDYVRHIGENYSSFDLNWTPR